MKHARSSRGFTLVEMIISMVVLGVLAGMLAVFIAKPIEGYVDTARRAGLTDTADLALKRMALDIRTAIPNSVRVSGTFLEYIPARLGGRYCPDDAVSCPSGASGRLSFSFTGTGGDGFDVLGPPHSAAANEFLVIYNTGQSALNAYNGSNMRLIAAAGTTATSIAFTGSAFPFASPSNRFQVIPATGPVTYACENLGGSTTGTGTLKRYTNYNTGLTFLNPQPTSGIGTGALLADNLTECAFEYQGLNARNGLVSLRLRLTRESESVTLMHQIHVDNMP